MLIYNIMLLYTIAYNKFNMAIYADKHSPACFLLLPLFDIKYRIVNDDFFKKSSWPYAS